MEDEATSTAAKRQTDRHNALADIQFASLIDGDLTPSEDETPEEKALQLETVQSAIGVSIGEQQTRLTSPKTPAAEKAAALDETDGGLFFEGWQQPQDETVIPDPPQAALTDDQEDEKETQDESLPDDEFVGGSPAARMPSPWRATPGTLRVDNRDHRAALRDSLTTGTRRRAMSGGSATETFKKYMPFTFPSMPKSSGLLNFSLPSFSVSPFDNARGRPSIYQRKRVSSANHSRKSSGIGQHDGTQISREAVDDTRPSPSQSLPRRDHSSTEPIPQHQFAATARSHPVPDAPSPSIDIDRQSVRLRRSNSEGSLLLHRPKSFASSLGDDTRFENVSEQVNSRMKAFKDSWQDSNFKLPSLPTMPNFSFASREDFFRSTRNGSTTPRGTNPDAANTSRVSFLATSNPSARNSSLKLTRAKESSSSIAGMNAATAATHPHFSRAVQDLTGDLVILGGYRGSVLRSAEAPHRQLWVPIKVGLNLRKVDLELGLNPEDEETEEKRIIPAGMLTHIGPVDIAKRLFKRLRASENARNGALRVHNYGYDWRLSPHLSSRRLIKYLETLPCNQPGVPPEKRGAIVLAHSLGGLVTRHAVNERPELFAGVIYAGVPQGCVNILGPLRNGDDVLLSSRVLTAQVNFTIRTSFALLPLDGKCFINKYTKEEYPVDFFDPNTWKDYSLSPCIAPPLPHPNIAPPLTSVSGILNAMSQALPSLPGRKASMSKGSTTSSTAHAADAVAETSAQTSGMAPQMAHTEHHNTLSNLTSSSASNPATTVTIPPDRATAYLTRTLATTKAFKLALAHKPSLTASNAYPPLALIYGKSTPTVYGAKVESREAIKRADAYDELAFASGDGVVLARAAMVPEGYSVVRGGVVSSDRGHVTLLGDLEAVGRCLNAVIEGRRRGVGLGVGGGQKGKGRERESGIGSGSGSGGE
ncbi:hypothetical protein K491DRAFT_613993 [Lophiostoma macrostomum CBS 122681]|uniref:Alpha/beta-hydrolase n=1 Tax=Lophiostoma macrostomum CBS 122681 TaxID=1314788 RepID=A0A6A6SNN4_9PLEO|nr:hypothetical protein K491DRAFT_613993 [Lophiostoma macrostomum CBS 122681]